MQNVLPGMEAAFVDIGTPKNAVLYRGDVAVRRRGRRGAGRAARASSRCCKAGQTIIVPGHEEPDRRTRAPASPRRCRSPGRFVVLVPNSRDLRHLEAPARRRAQAPARRSSTRSSRPSTALIVRTAAEGVTDEELERDVLRLLDAVGADRRRSAKQAKAPALLYQEPDLAVRVIREEFNKEYRGVVIDDPALYEEVRDYVDGDQRPSSPTGSSTTTPRPRACRSSSASTSTSSCTRRSTARCGCRRAARSIIEHTEALTVIDVNTGKNVGTSNLEETVFRNNLEAAEEIARQLRLRDIGGIIVIDFIDMEIRENRDDGRSRRSATRWPGTRPAPRCSTSPSSAWSR